MVDAAKIKTSKILRAAYAALGKDRRRELARSHAERITERARAIVAPRQDRDRRAQQAQLWARKASLAASRAYQAVIDAESSENYRQEWRGAKAVVEMNCEGS